MGGSPHVPATLAVHDAHVGSAKLCLHMGGDSRGGGLLGHRASNAQVPCCSSLSVLAACVQSCVSGWGLKVSQMSCVDAMAVLRLCATARNVTCAFLG